MSENARKKSSPESHLIERQLAKAPLRAWAGYVRIAGDEGTLMVPGTWHLELPNEVRPLRDHARREVPLPTADGLDAWREHLMRIVTLQVAGMQLRVRDARDGAWRALEFAAPTMPPSVVHVDREGWHLLLGQGARLTLAVDTESH